VLLQDPEVLRHLSVDEVAACFDLTPYLEHVDTIFARLGL